MFIALTKVFKQIKYLKIEKRVNIKITSLYGMMQHLVNKNDSVCALVFCHKNFPNILMLQ